MSVHIFANFVTSFGTAANNRAETEGNVTTLQKLLWMGETHSSVSAEAIRFALRRLLAGAEDSGANRAWDEVERVNGWKEPDFKGWDSEKGKTYIDDDLLGFMKADAASEEGESGSANVRRAVLEVTRAVSLTPWAGDVTFNAASPGATPSAAKKGQNPVPYGTELHATRYQYGIALTPERLRDKSRAAKAVKALCELGTVAGNHGRFLFDFSPDAVVIRITDDPAPRLLYCFDTADSGKSVGATALVQRIKTGDIAPAELIVGVSDLNSPLADQLQTAGVKQVVGVKAARDAAVAAINKQLGVKG
jgi:CRISPR-associated protein Cst2